MNADWKTQQVILECGCAATRFWYRGTDVGDSVHHLMGCAVTARGQRVEWMDREQAVAAKQAGFHDETD